MPEEDKNVSVSFNLKINKSVFEAYLHFVEQPLPVPMEQKQIIANSMS